MIHQLNNIFILTDEQENHMSGIPDSDKPDEWVKTNAFMTNIRASITAQLDGFQNQKCCYCGLDLWETGRGEIEHIAPKSSRQRAYPEFTFEKQNLALACEYCNGSSKKGETDIVLRYSPTYSNCEFKLVHPYFDNPNDHYEWINNKTQIVVSESLHYSFFHLNHKTFKKYGLLGFENNPALKDFKSDFQKITKRVNQNKDKFTDDYICPCCGEKQKIDLPEDILQYKFLLENQKLTTKIGLIYLDEFTEIFKKNLADKFYSFLPEINSVDNPKCIILVEGESEEASIPLLAFRKRFILSQHEIQVYNSKSKSKLLADFLSFKANYPNRKIICLLDSDALKEKTAIERIIGNQKNKYKCVFIKKGTFEDIFDLEISIEILNKLYPVGEIITVSDFDSNKDFLSNVGKIMHFKKKAQFNKVLFAKTISLQMDIEKLPSEIKEIIEIAEKFTSKHTFIKN